MKKIGFIICLGTISASCFAQRIIKGNIGIFHSVSRTTQIYFFSGSPLHSNRSSDSKLSAPFIQLNENAQATYNVTCFPNPASTIVHCQLTNNKHITKILLYSIDGILIKEAESSPIDVTNLPSGIYFLEAFDEQNTVYTNKITVIN